MPGTILLFTLLILTDSFTVATIGDILSINHPALASRFSMCQKTINGSFPFIPIIVFNLREWKGQTFLNAICSFHLKWVTFWQFISEIQVINLRVILHGAMLKAD